MKPESEAPWEDHLAWVISRYLSSQYNEKIAREVFRLPVFEDIPCWGIGKKKTDHPQVVFLLMQKFMGGYEKMMTTLWSDCLEEMGHEVTT